MAKLASYLALIVGLLSPVLALRLYSLVYTTLTQASNDRDKDWFFRLAVSTLAMTIPFFATVALAWIYWRQRRQPEATSRSEKRRQQRSDSRSAETAPNGTPMVVKIGLVVAALSLFLTWRPIRDGIHRSQQVRNMALRDVTAPVFDTHGY